MTEEPVTIRCAACAEPIVTVPAKTAEAFASGTWLCSRPACHEKR
jgi:hypothetical protein